MSEERERELKFETPDDWSIPDPDVLVPPGGRVRRAVVELESTYYDTDEHALLDAWLTMRRRTGDTDQGWQLKVPDACCASSASSLTRRVRRGWTVSWLGTPRVWARYEIFWCYADTSRPSWRPCRRSSCSARSPPGQPHTFDERLAATRSTLGVAMRSRRYLALLDDLATWDVAPPVAADAEPAGTLERYQRTAAKKYRRRSKHARSLRPGDPRVDDAPAPRRKAAKRARYTAELAEPVDGDATRRATRRAEKAQNRLREHQDAVVAGEFLRALGAAAGSTTGENGFTYGLLLARLADKAGLDLTAS